MFSGRRRFQKDPAVQAAGFFVGGLHAKAKATWSWFYLGMNRSGCQKPPVSADGGSRGSDSPAEVLPQPGLPVGVLDLRVLRSRAAVLWRGVPAPGPSRSTSRRQPAASAERRGPAGSSRPPARLSLPAVSMPRDGSRFSIRSIWFTIGGWKSDHDAGGCSAACAAA